MKNVILLIGFVAACSFLGCQSAEPSVETAGKLNRPVEVGTLQETPPPTATLVSASVASWKTEQIGFEVTGRIKWVAEPNTEIEGRVYEMVDSVAPIDPEEGANPTRNVGDVDGEPKLLIAGTPVAQIEDDRYRLQFKMAEAEVTRASQAVIAAEIKIKDTLIARMKAAVAKKNLAESELERTKSLWEQNAISDSDLDRDEANVQTAIAEIEQLKAETKTEESNLASLKIEVEQAKQSRRDAKRELDDCTLYSSFRGKIASIAVVPGSVVNSGDPVATIQMMDPIKIELEVSAETSRALRKRQRIPVWLPSSDKEPEEGFLYLIDSVADPLTRTFTVTLLVLNRKTGLKNTETADFPITNQVWRLNLNFLPGAKKGVTYVVQHAIHYQKDYGHFVWRVENMSQHQPMPQDSLIKVRKMKVELGESKLPFLGNWIFQQVVLLDDDFDPELNLVAGRLQLENGDPDDWEGDTILVDRDSQWLVRPGDVVKVDLSNTHTKRGIYVPMDALVRDAGETYLFLIDNEDTDPEKGAKVSKIEVVVENPFRDSTSSLRRIVAKDEFELVGRRYVTLGAHYLEDAEMVRIIEPSGAQQ